MSDWNIDEEMKQDVAEQEDGRYKFPRFDRQPEKAWVTARVDTWLRKEVEKIALAERSSISGVAGVFLAAAVEDYYKQKKEAKNG